MSSNIENVYEVSFEFPTQTNPFFNVKVGDVDPVTFAVKVIDAFAALLDLGTYPIFLARETTFSRSVAESKKDSFTTMFELNAVI